MPAPAGVVSEIRPEVAPLGTVVVIVVAVAAVTMERVPLKATRLPDVVLSKFVPAILTVVPVAPMAGVKLVMVGTSEPIVNGMLLETVPADVVTVISPLVAPTGTAVEI